MGSSPLTWRIPSSMIALKRLFRIISTYVENTKYLRSQLQCYQDHLHLRGEYAMTVHIDGLIMGSSPLTWRIPVRSLAHAALHGIISTYVENTLCEQLVKASIRDHLHLRGEYLLCFFINVPLIGSSPLTWRIPFVEIGGNCSFGIISTYVENTIAHFFQVRV